MSAKKIPDYHKIIKSPMDLLTMQKVHHAYKVAMVTNPVVYGGGGGRGVELSIYFMQAFLFGVPFIFTEESCKKKKVERLEMSDCSLSCCVVSDKPNYMLVIIDDLPPVLYRFHLFIVLLSVSLQSFMSEFCWFWGGGGGGGGGGKGGLGFSPKN